jgi:hypothetical protein
MSRLSTSTTAIPSSLLRALVVGVAAAALGLPAAAAPQVFFGIDNSAFPSPATQAEAAKTQFVTAAGAGSITTQDYETAPVGDLGAVTSGVLANGVGVTVANTVSGANSLLRVTDGGGGFDTYAHSGQRFLEMLSDNGTTYFTVDFASPIDGLGFFVSDIADWMGTAGPLAHLQAVLKTTDNTTLELDLTPGQDPADLVSGNMAFFGVLGQGTRFTSFAIRSPASLPGGDALGIDDFMVVLQPNRVPEPAGLGLAALALAGLAVSRRARRKS